MSEPIIKRVDEIDFYQGPDAIAGIRFRTAGRALGVTAFGMNVIEIDGGCERYPEHDHVKDGQEEVYAVLSGSARLVTSSGEVPVSAGAIVKVPPDVKRKWIPGADGVTLLAVGATPGKAYGT